MCLIISLLLLSSCGTQSATLAPDELPIITTPTLAGTPTSIERDRLFLANYGLKALEAPEQFETNIPTNNDRTLPFSLYLPASQAVGLDFTSYEGKMGFFRNYLVGFTQKEHFKIYAHLLIVDDQIIGTWMSVEHYAPGIFPINTPLDELP